MLRAVIAVLIFVGLPACRTRPLKSDGEQSPDAGSAQCVLHQLEQAPLSSIERLDADLPSWTSTLRVRIGLALTGCDVVGQVTSERQIGDATDGIEISAQVWRATASCGPRRIQYWALDFPSPQNVYLHLYDKLQSVTLSVSPTNKVSASCEPAGPGNSCTADCQCAVEQPGAGCVLMADSGACLRTCNQDPDCVDPLRPFCTGPGLFGRSHCVAATTPTDCSQCHFPLRCETGSCLPPKLGTRRACNCQSDCDAGQICDGTGHCATPCTSDQACPREAGCVNSQCFLLE